MSAAAAPHRLVESSGIGQALRLGGNQADASLLRLLLRDEQLQIGGRAESVLLTDQIEGALRRRSGDICACKA